MPIFLRRKATSVLTSRVWNREDGRVPGGWLENQPLQREIQIPFQKNATILRNNNRFFVADVQWKLFV